MRPGEIITAIEIPALPFAQRSALSQGSRSRELRVRARVRGGRARRHERANSRRARGVRRRSDEAVAIARQRSARSSARRATAATFRAAAEAALRGAVPREDNAFKVELAKRTLVRALTEVSA